MLNEGEQVLATTRLGLNKRSDRHRLPISTKLLCKKTVSARQHIGDGVRFSNYLVDARIFVVFAGNHFRETRRDDHRQVGTKLLDPTRDVKAAQFRQAEVANSGSGSPMLRTMCRRRRPDARGNRLSIRRTLERVPSSLPSC